MVFTNKHAKILVDEFPYFKNSKTLKDEIEFYKKEDDEVSPAFILLAFTDYVINELIPSSSTVTDEELKIYNYLEKKRVEFCLSQVGTDEKNFDDVICTCFFEDLINSASSGNIQYERFIPYLGEKSKEYCKAWDQFTGVRSPGLWVDLEWHRAPKGPSSMIEDGSQS